MAEQHTSNTSIAAAAAALTASKRGDAEPENSDTQQQEKSNPIISFLVNILKLLPLPKNRPEKPEEVAEFHTPVIEESVEEPKPSFVTFPKEKDFPSLKFEAEDGDTNTNPLLLYQVYVIGGFFVLRWAWCRWNEHRGKKKTANEDPSSNEDPTPPLS